MYDFLNYCHKIDVETAYATSKDALIHEMLSLGFQNIAADVVWNYFCKKTEAHWHQFGILEFCLQSANLLSSPMQISQMYVTSIGHLSRCLTNSFDNCDFKEKWYGTQSVPICGLCFKEIAACESGRYCARCYRDVLNNWRPI